MSREKGFLRVRCITACTGGNGPDFDFCVVELSVEQYEVGEHYEAAKCAAEDHGFDTENAVVYDTLDLSNTVGVKFQRHFQWRTADLYSVDGVAIDVFDGKLRNLGNDL